MKNLEKGDIAMDLDLDTLELQTWNGTEWIVTEPTTLEEAVNETPPLEVYHAISRMELANVFSIYGDDGNMLVQMDLETGEVEFGENFTHEESIRTFWKYIGAAKDMDIDEVWEECSTTKTNHATFDDAMKVIE